MTNSLKVFNEWGIHYLGWALCPGTEFAMVEIGSITSEVVLNAKGQAVIDAINAGNP